MSSLQARLQPWLATWGFGILQLWRGLHRPVRRIVPRICCCEMLNTDQALIYIDISSLCCFPIHAEPTDQGFALSPLWATFNCSLGFPVLCPPVPHPLHGPAMAMPAPLPYPEIEYPDLCFTLADAQKAISHILALKIIRSMYFNNVQADESTGLCDWRITNATASWEAQYRWPPDPMWTESYWDPGLPSLRLYQVGFVLAARNFIFTCLICAVPMLADVVKKCLQLVFGQVSLVGGCKVRSC